MSLSVAALRELVNLGLTAEQILRVAEAQAGAEAQSEPQMTARQARNRRHYERLKASENRLKASETSENGEQASPPLPPSPQTPQPPTPPREDNTPLPPKSSDRRKPKRKIPDGYPDAEAIAEHQAKARSVGANIDISVQAERFRNWAISNDARYADWAATFRNWCLRAIESAPKTAVAASRARGMAPSQDDRWRRWLREFRQNGHWPVDDAGPRPGHPACRVPHPLLVEFGFTPAPANDAKPDLLERAAS